MQLREQMKADLTRAMKARQSETVATLRSVLAAIDNAEAVPVETPTQPIEPIAGQRHEVPRKVLSLDDIRQMVQKELDERRAASATYAQLGQSAEAERLATAADLLAGYLNA
ncbi:MAG: GatB/YqeY domain-containing protein [Caldilineaceae bacterium]|nr:GatB/YqeY domain-containing protein [Caldilineaceae bacterium]